MGGAGPGKSFRTASPNSRHSPPAGVLPSLLLKAGGMGGIKWYSYIHSTIFKKCQVLSHAGQFLPDNAVVSALA